MDIVERLCKYVSYSTTSVDDCETIPSNPEEFRLRDDLAEELREMGIDRILADEYCYLYATIPANCSHAPRIAFIAHLDTSSSAPGTDVKPLIREKDGKRVVCTDGTTLLGGDDKAGIAAIMTMAEYLQEHPEFPHGEIRIVFTPDEETGNSTEKINVEAIGTDFAYTIDGGDCREVEAENMYGHTVKVIVNGHNAHPGYAKGIMKHAGYIAMEFEQMMPAGQRADQTEGREDFYYLAIFNAMARGADMLYFVRGAEESGLKRTMSVMEQAAAFLNHKYGENTVTLEVLSKRRNMMEVLREKPYVYDLACRAVEKVTGERKTQICRGGFDGVTLSFRGIPCPNLGAGDYNMHAVDEYVVIDEMKQSVEIMLEIIKESTCLPEFGGGQEETEE